MGFFGRLLYMLSIGLIVGMLVGLFTHSPTLSVVAFLLWCASKQRIVFSEPKDTEKPEDKDS